MLGRALKRTYGAEGPLSRYAIAKETGKPGPMPKRVRDGVEKLRKGVAPLLTKLGCAWGR